LNFLEDFSSGLLTRSKQLEDDLQDLVYEAEGSQIKLHNTFNDFLMLSDAQFIENVSSTPSGHSTSLYLYYCGFLFLSGVHIIRLSLRFLTCYCKGAVAA